MGRLLQRVINSLTFLLLFFDVVLGCAYKIKLELMHSDKTVFGNFDENENVVIEIN